MNNSYLFLSDLDGTLLTSEKRISPQTMQTLREFVEAGNHFAICTGRDINSARSVYENLNLNLKGSYVIAYNGGQIYDVDACKTIYRDGLDQDMVLDILSIAEEYDIHIHTYNDDFILSTKYNGSMDFYRRVIKTPLIVADDIRPYMTEKPCKMICIELHDHEKQEAFRAAIMEKYPDQIATMYSSQYYLEVIPKTSGKGSALVKLRDYLGIQEDHTIASGDEGNDISMIQAARYGIAMLNASDEVKGYADIITPEDNDHDGLAPILRKFI